MDQGILVQVLFRTCKPTLAVRVWFSSYQQQFPIQLVGIKQIMILIFYITFVESESTFSACICCTGIAEIVLFVCRRKSSNIIFGQTGLLLVMLFKWQLFFLQIPLNSGWERRGFYVISSQVSDPDLPDFQIISQSYCFLTVF